MIETRRVNTVAESPNFSDPSAQLDEPFYTTELAGYFIDTMFDKLITDVFDPTYNSQRGADGPKVMRWVRSVRANILDAMETLTFDIGNAANFSPADFKIIKCFATTYANTPSSTALVRAINDRIEGRPPRRATPQAAAAPVVAQSKAKDPKLETKAKKIIDEYEIPAFPADKRSEHRWWFNEVKEALLSVRLSGDLISPSLTLHVFSVLLRKHEHATKAVDALFTSPVLSTDPIYDRELAGYLLDELTVSIQREGLGEPYRPSSDSDPEKVKKWFSSMPSSEPIEKLEDVLKGVRDMQNPLKFAKDDFKSLRTLVVLSTNNYLVTRVIRAIDASIAGRVPVRE